MRIKELFGEVPGANGSINFHVAGNELVAVLRWQPTADSEPMTVEKRFKLDMNDIMFGGQLFSDIRNLIALAKQRRGK